MILINICWSGPFSRKIVHFFSFMVKKIVGYISRTFEFLRLYFIWIQLTVMSMWNYFGWLWLRMLSERLIFIFQLSRRMFLDFLKSPLQQFQNQYENHFFLSLKSPVFFKDETTLQYLISKLSKSNDCVAVIYAKLSVKVFITVLV